ncbi:hypothetical protein DVH24_015589 [Malus domestica]|uniref:Uncharacterized protein n=1 Tax=Malus domestica TaxID=3750 RepID=A0A498HNI0_MALDO|nr:hypothetical protein DVH24_015589 [Malus domestica]
MLKSAQSVRMIGSKIKIQYDSRHCGATTSQQHSGVASGCGVVIKQNCPMQWDSWTDIPQRTMELALMVEKHAAVVQEATSQFPPNTPIEDVTVPEDVGFQIVTDVMEQNFGRRHGKVVQCMGKARVREMGASSSNSNIAEVDALKEQVTTLQGQLEIQGEQMKEQMRVQAEQMKE